MISALISLLILLIIMGIVYWIFTLIPLPAPFKQIGLVVLLLIFLLVAIGMLFGGWHFPIVVHD